MIPRPSSRSRASRSAPWRDGDPDPVGHGVLAWLTLPTRCDSTARMDELAGLGIGEYEPVVRLVRPVL